MKSSLAMIRAIGLCALGLLVHAGTAGAWMWDQNQDKIDDRIAAVETQGLTAAHVGGDLAKRLRFAVFNTTAPFEYGVYVGYDHHPTDADAASLAALGVPVQKRYLSIDYIRTRVTYAQIVQIATLSGVTRIESIPVMYAVNDVASRALRARDSGNELFPSVWKDLGVKGEGVVVGILDSGVNDAPDTTTGYPGHESLRGKWLGGGDFFSGDPALNTPLNQSINPRHTADPEVTYHGTHVAGTAIGTGGPQGILGGNAPGFYAGMAPAARLVDCKVLSDAGTGLGSADALDWCIYHKNDLWGLTGADTVYRGIDVINMSVGSSDESDGTDANSAAVNAAHRAGIVVCVATGNDGEIGYMASPAAADMAVSVGAFADDNTVKRDDDYVTDYSNEGPRNADSDSDQLDEMKPNVCGSGTGIMSVLGDPTTQGNQYHHINGTSMACPSVAGVAALVRSANPALSADQVRQILMDTAEHRTDRGKQPASAVDPYGLDPNYHPSWGWGAIDAYAAVKEAQNAGTVQVVRIATDPVRAPDGFHVRWWTQREALLSRFELDRAPDVNGQPGAWTLIHQLPVATPQTQIHRVANRHLYEYTDLDASLDPSKYYWYRLRWIDAAAESHSEPPMRARIQDSPVYARVKYSWTHDYSDGDLAVKFGTGTSTFTPVWFRAGLGAQSADSVHVLPGDAWLGTKQHFFHVDLTQDEVGTFLPPSAANPWFLSVKEGGYVNTVGRVNDFSVTVFGPTTTTYTAPNPVTQNVEKQETVFWIPLNPATSTNHAPVLSPIGPKSIGEGLTLGFAVSATDADGNTLTYAADNLPAGASFNAGTHVFQWTPGYTASGNYSVRFRVGDNALIGAAADTEVVVITVTDRNPGDNLPPRLDPLTDRAGVAGERVTFRVTARDPEGAALTYSATGLPSGATLDVSTGIFDWIPTPGQTGIYPVTFAATDPGSLADSAPMHLVISAAATGAPPSQNCVASQSTISGVAEEGIDPISTSVNHHSFVVAPGTQTLEATLSWLVPARDLDFYLLDADSNVVTSSASVSDPEHVLVTLPAPGTYIWRVVSFTNPDTCHYTISSTTCQATVLAVGDGPKTHPFSLAASAPNPVRDLGAIRFSLPHSGVASLKVYDVSGRLVRTLQRGWLPAGSHVRVWDRKTDAGSLVSPGLYFTRLESEGRTLSRKVTVLE